MNKSDLFKKAALFTAAYVLFKEWKSDLFYDSNTRYLFDFFDRYKIFCTSEFNLLGNGKIEFYAIIRLFDGTILMSEKYDNREYAENDCFLLAFELLENHLN